MGNNSSSGARAGNERLDPPLVDVGSISESRNGCEWHDPPLAVVVNRFLASKVWEERPMRQEVESHFQLLNSKPHLLAADLRDWSLCCLFLHDDEMRPLFKSTMSDTQFGSFRILLEWWTGHIQDQSLSAAAIAYVVLGSIEQLPQRGKVLFTKSTESSYHRTLWKLFRMEFGTVEKPPSSTVFPDILPRTRNYAAISACTQRIGSAFYRQAVRDEYGDESEENRQSNTSQDFNQFSYSIAAPMNDILIDLSSSEGFQVNDLETKIQRPLIAATCWPYRASQIQDLLPPNNTLGAVLEPCPWLTVADKNQKSPRFLWDTMNKKTVDTMQFNSCPPYTAISHTWGRWRLETKNLVAVLGALWLVPQNSRFSVEKIPEILNSVPGGSRYIWFDLVCIPQETTDPYMVEIIRDEIAHQASIFSQAQQAIAWFSEVDSFEGLEKAARWMAFYLLEHPASGLNNFDLFEDETRKPATTASPVLFDPALGYSPENGWDVSTAVNGWLTSLWTLQEACLRPDMWLCTKNWTVLQVDKKTPLQLDGLVSLAQQTSFDRVVDTLAGPRPVQKRLSNWLQAPEVVQMVVLAVQLSGISGLLDETRNEILWMGDRRYCKENRAEAIISVIGATDWYEGYKGQTERSKLVLGRYPLAFVENARRNVGAMFFGSVIKNEFLQGLITGETQIGARDIGSMMPFGAPAGMSAKGPGILEHGKPIEHPSVASWEIQEDGSVRIVEAGILTSSDTTIRTPIEGFVMDLSANVTDSMGPSLDSALTRMIVDLRKWVRSQSYVCYAVCLVHRQDYDETQNDRECRIFSGIVLREIMKGYLLKIGMFTTMPVALGQDDIPSTKQVDWIVL